MNLNSEDNIRTADKHELSIDELEIVVGGCSGAGKVTLQPFHFTHTYDRASPVLA